MNQYEALLAVKAHHEKRAMRNSLFRHRRLLPRPMVIVPWQLGGEPFSASAIGFGCTEDGLSLVVAGDPRNRDLAFAALREFAGWFIPRFEEPARDRQTQTRYGHSAEVSRSIPQVVVPNRESVAFLGRVGRRLAYLPMIGNAPAPIELVRLGQHLQFVARHAAEPGQQLIIPLARFVAEYWVTPQTEVERASLAALEAFIEPSPHQSGYEAALAAETLSVGPTPAAQEDEVLERLVDALNRVRAGGSDPASIRPSLVPIEAHYRRLTETVWRMVWRALEREMRYQEAPSVQRRWNVDREQYTRHMDWVAISGRRRTRQSARQAILTMRRLEDSKRLLEAEVALDDPLRMIPYLLDGKAVEGEVISEDPDYQEVAKVKLAKRPLVSIRAETDRPLPLGKRLHWTGDPGGPEWEVHSVQPSSGGSFLVTMKLTTGGKHVRPAVGDWACFSVHGFGRWFARRLSDAPPWPLVPANEQAVPQPIEGS